MLLKTEKISFLHVVMCTKLKFLTHNEKQTKPMYKMLVSYIALFRNSGHCNVVKVMWNGVSAYSIHECSDLPCYKVGQGLFSSFGCVICLVQNEWTDLYYICKKTTAQCSVVLRGKKQAIHERMLLPLNLFQKTACYF